MQSSPREAAVSNMVECGGKFLKNLIFPEPDGATAKTVSKFAIVSLVYLSLVLDNILLTVVGKFFCRC